MTSDQSKNQTVTNMMMKMTTTSIWKFHYTEKVFPQGSPPLSIREESSNSDEPTNSTLNQDEINLLSELLAVPTEDRKRQHDKDLTNEVAKTSDDRFNNMKGSPIFSKIPKTN